LIQQNSVTKKSVAKRKSKSPEPKKSSKFSGATKKKHESKRNISQQVPLTKSNSKKSMLKKGPSKNKINAKKFWKGGAEESKKESSKDSTSAVPLTKTKIKEEPEKKMITKNDEIPSMEKEMKGKTDSENMLKSLSSKSLQTQDKGNSKEKKAEITADSKSSVGMSTTLITLSPVEDKRSDTPPIRESWKSFTPKQVNILLVQKGLKKELASEIEGMEIDGETLEELRLKDLLDAGMKLGRAKTIMRTVIPLQENLGSRARLKATEELFTAAKIFRNLSEECIIAVKTIATWIRYSDKMKSKDGTVEGIFDMVRRQSTSTPDSGQRNPFENRNPKLQIPTTAGDMESVYTLDTTKPPSSKDNLDKIQAFHEASTNRSHDNNSQKSDETHRPKLYADDLGYNPALVESFAESVLKFKPTSLDTMIQLRYGLLEFARSGKAKGFLSAVEEDDEMSKGNESDVDMSSDEESVASKLIFSKKHRKGFFKRMFKYGQPVEESDLMTHEDSVISTALLEANRKNDDLAIHMFKAVMCFMGDKKSRKPQEEQAKTLHRIALLSEPSIRDELYLQICKQVNGHPDMNRCLEGWTLLLLCLMSFRPSNHDEVLGYVEKTIKNTQFQEVKEKSLQAKKLMHIIALHPEAEEVPLGVELKHLQDFTLIPITVRLPYTSGSEAKSIEIGIDPFTLIAEVEHIMFKKLGLTFTTCFGLFEANDFAFEPLLERRRVLDVMSSWQASLENNRDLLEENSKNRSLYFKAISDEKLEKASKRRRAQSVPPGSLKRNSLGGRSTRRARGTRRSRRAQARYEYFLFQCKLPVPIAGRYRMKQLLDDPVAIEILYEQSRRDFMQGKLSYSERDLPKLCALMLKIHEEEKEVLNPADEILFARILPKYIPASFIEENFQTVAGEKALNNVMTKMVEKHKKLTKCSTGTCKRSFIAYTQRSSTYGVHFFPVEQRKQLRRLPDFFNVGISSSGVVFQHPVDLSITNNYSLKDIVTWGHSKTKFILVVGDVVQQKKFVFYTKKGELMKRFIQTAIQLEIYQVKNSDSLLSSIKSKSKFGISVVELDTKLPLDTKLDAESKYGGRGILDVPVQGSERPSWLVGAPQSRQRIGSIKGRPGYGTRRLRSQSQGTQEMLSARHRSSPRLDPMNISSSTITTMKPLDVGSAAQLTEAGSEQITPSPRVPAPTIENKGFDEDDRDGVDNDN